MSCQRSLRIRRQQVPVYSHKAANPGTRSRRVASALSATASPVLRGAQLLLPLAPPEEAAEEEKEERLPFSQTFRPLPRPAAFLRTWRSTFCPDALGRHLDAAPCWVCQWMSPPRHGTFRGWLVLHPWMSLPLRGGARLVKACSATLRVPLLLRPPSLAALKLTLRLAKAIGVVPSFPATFGRFPGERSAEPMSVRHWMSPLRARIALTSHSCALSW